VLFIYDQILDARSWFDPTATISGWFDEEFVDDTEAAPPTAAVPQRMLVGMGL
jgi:hypothetical protein